ncbi:MAG: hypothetical protein E7436_01080 [Ruminococcaceae bacterium]|nr:hypothetical protein [Oscillospiraceae bacterium]
MRINMERMRSLLRGRQQVSVPQLQQELAIGYGQSRLLVAELVSCGWLEEVPAGVDFAVRQEFLEPRLLSRPEMEQLYPQMTADMVRAMERIMLRPGADVLWIEQGVHGMEDTVEAINALLERDVITRCGGRHCLRITNAAAALLMRLLEDRPSMPFAARHREQTEAWQRAVREMLDAAYQNAQMI